MSKYESVTLAWVCFHFYPQRFQISLKKNLPTKQYQRECLSGSMTDLLDYFGEKGFVSQFGNRAENELFERVGIHSKNYNRGESFLIIILENQENHNLHAIQKTLIDETFYHATRYSQR